MFDITKLRLFPFSSGSVFIPVEGDSNYNIIFYSENSNFVSAYPSLGIRRQYAKKITMAPFKVPRLVVTMKNLIKYKTLGLIPTMKADSNTFVDATPFFDILDNAYGKASYKRPVVLSKAVSYLNQAKGVGDGTNKSILMYHVDMTKEIPGNIIHRRSIILAMIAKLGDGRFPFDCVVVALQSGGSTKFSSIYNKNSNSVLNFSKIISVFKRIKPDSGPDEEKPESGKVITSMVPMVPSSNDDTEKKSILKTIDKFRNQKITK